MNDNLYLRAPHARTRWFTFENQTGEKGKGGTSNNGAKGHAAEPVPPGATKVLCDFAGSGKLTRIWITLSDRSPIMLRALRLRITWDNAEKPAVDVPLGDFFCAPLGMMVAFENELFSNPEGRSLNCRVPMPFKTHVRVEITNESDVRLNHFFYEIDMEEGPQSPDAMYFHAWWNRECPNQLGREYTLLPKICGEGKIIGINAGILLNMNYGNAWWGEGEVKAFLDGDTEYPTLCGTGSEDYIGTAWAVGAFSNQTQGCPIADWDPGRFGFYRLHTQDPIHFKADARMTLQVLGGALKASLVEADVEKDPKRTPFQAVACDNDGEMKLLYQPGEKAPALADLPDGWINFFREDDLSSTVYLYLTEPASNLPGLAPCAKRIIGV